MAYDTQDFLEDTSQEIPVTTDPVCHKIHINRNLARLQDYAKRLRVFNTLKNYLEIAIE